MTAPFTLFYIDPPYWGHEADYERGLFARGDFGRLLDALRGIKGRFILSLNDHPEVRRLFAWAEREEMRTAYALNGWAKRPVQELLTSGGG